MNIQFATCNVSTARKFLKKIYKTEVPDSLFEIIREHIKQDKVRIMDPDFHGSAISQGKKCNDEEWKSIIASSLKPFNEKMIELQNQKWE